MPTTSDRALLVLHATPERLAAIPRGEEIVRYIQGEMRYFRERGRLIVFALPDLPEGELVDASRVIADLTPRTHEHLLATTAPDAFFDTPLERFLEQNNVKRLTLVGVDAAKEVLLTAAGALARGFRVVVPEPCVASGTDDDRDAALRLVNEIWRETKEEVTHPAFENPVPEDAPNT